jgi:putative transposase
MTYWVRICRAAFHSRQRWQVWKLALLSRIRQQDESQYDGGTALEYNHVMPNFQRYYIPNAIVFITSVTKKRYPYLQSKNDVELFFETICKVREYHPFRILAHVILPDHFHWLMKVDDPDGDFSKILHSIKRNFTLNYKRAHNIQTSISIWQSRFWDHVVRDESDLARHFDYIHWNPVKHGFVNQPERWPYSTFQDWMDKGYYKTGWDWSEELENLTGMEFE